MQNMRDSKIPRLSKNIKLESQLRLPRLDSSLGTLYPKKTLDWSPAQPRFESPSPLSQTYALHSDSGSRALECRVQSSVFRMWDAFSRGRIDSTYTYTFWESGRVWGVRFGIEDFRIVG